MRLSLLLRLLLLSLFAFVTTHVHAQSTVSGRVVDYKGDPVKGANVYLLNTIDGATSDSTGAFSFTTEETGEQTIVAEEISLQDAGRPINISGDVTGLELKMKRGAVQLRNVTVTAGSFEASGSESATLNPIDIVTTAGSQGDVVRAIQTLPGTQQQGTQTGLFVRGGDASETAVIIDGMVAQNAFLSTAPGVAARSRFGPFQFKGVSFSSGGYSARYGQALSSVLELNSNDQPTKSTINMGLNMAGVYASASKIFKKTSIEASCNYINLSPFYGIAKTNFDFYEVPKGGGGSTKFTYTPNKNGIFKALVNYAQFQNGTRLPDPSDGSKTLDFGLKNRNVYTVLSYQQKWKAKWGLYVAGMYSYNQDDIEFNTVPIVNKDDRAQMRLEGKYYAGTKFTVLLGTEIQHFTFDRTFSTFNSNFEETQVAGYLEAEWVPINWLALKPGVRYEHSAIINQDAIAPRFAAAIRSGLHGQFSVASGIFYQIVDPQYYILGYRPGFQNSIHYIANYQYMNNDRTLRLEAYYKDYNQLVRERLTGAFDPNSFRQPIGSVDNSGYGYAQGLELFWRDKKSVKNGDYWISYSFIDTRRLFKNYIAEVQPDFIATHTLNLVTKYFVQKWHTQFNATYNYATGRPYYNPTNADFMGDRTPDYHNLSITVNYLKSFGKWFSVIYAGIDNVTNNKNVFGYRYSGGTRSPIVPPIYRSVFMGVNFSLTAFDLDEL
ncbi:MAG: TonB-dependent receptor [Chitinophagales bacterium]|nr:TonB-dependent receptor [Chitinophagaceae bacterium]MCB9064002.1 TonB-dependent receptor [Chitinophagales bacterium]